MSLSACMANFMGGIQLTCVCSFCTVTVFMSKIPPLGGYSPHSVIPSFFLKTSVHTLLGVQKGTSRSASLCFLSLAKVIQYYMS